MPLTLTVTNAGRAALVNAANTGTAPVTIAQVGLSGTAVVPAATATALPGEFKRLATLSGDVVADDTIHLIVRDESADVFTVRSAALYLGDGTLFAIYGQADVLVEKSAQALMLLAIDVRFEDIDAAAITFGDTNFLNPPATTEQMGVVELSTLAETVAGTDTSRVPAAKMVKDAVFAWLDARFGANNAGIWHPGNDGAGSGLDADLLDGSQASEFARLASGPTFTGDALTLTPATSIARYALAGYGFAGARTISLNQGVIGVSNSGFSIRDETAGANRLEIDGTGTVNFPGSLTRAGNVVWHAGNDGAGSGLDADLLDGLDSSRFVYGTNSTKTTGISDINSALPSGFYNGYSVPSAPNADWWHYIHSRHTNESNNFAAQIAFNFYSNDFRFRTIDNNTPKAWARVWHDQNDGSGSGLDADLLDGLNSWSYARTDTSNTLLGSVLIQAPSVGSSLLKVRNTGDNASIAIVGDGGTEWGQLALSTYNASADFRVIAANSLRLEASGSLTFNGNAVWNAANDGSGSGLDADLLDGQQGSAYALRGQDVTFRDVIASRGDGSGVIYFGTSGLRYLHYDGGAYVLPNAPLAVNGGWVWTASNDGAGSGLDADLLDGYHGSAFALLSGATFTGSVNVQNGAFGGVRLVSGGGNTGYVEFNNPAGVRQGYIGWAETGGYIALSAEGAAGWESNKKIRAAAGGGVATLDSNGDITADRGNGTGVIYFGPAANGRYLYSDGSQYHMPGANLAVNGGLVWHSANDGAGSGLDADLLDGYEGSAYDRIVSSNLAENGGYIIYASGYKKCWGVATVNGNTSTTISYPITFDQFSNASFSAARQDAGAQDNDPQVYAQGLASCTVYNAAYAMTGRWRAEGK